MTPVPDDQKIVLQIQVLQAKISGRVKVVGSGTRNDKEIISLKP